MSANVLRRSALAKVKIRQPYNKAPEIYSNTKQRLKARHRRAVLFTYDHKAKSAQHKNGRFIGKPSEKTRSAFMVLGFFAFVA